MKLDLNYLNIKNYKNLYRNISIPKLIEFAVKREEGVLSDKGALVVNTGKYTGRSPNDRFIVKDNITKDTVNWGKGNLAIDEHVFDEIYNDVLSYLNQKDLFMFDGFIGALKEYTLPIRVICECAYQAMFSNQMFIRPDANQLSNYIPEFNIISVPGFKARGIKDGINSEAFVLINFSKKIILIGGTAYSGEIKKSAFSVINFLLPQKGVLPMHCSANTGNDGRTTIFFGLSGTGKTTLSTDIERKLIGDDEHGWCDDGVFNFEGGCYAKAIGLNKEKEQEIYSAIKFGTVLENVVIDENGTPDYNDRKFTENTRAAYPIEHIDNIESSGVGSIPNKIIFLTADAFGVMPPISKLTKESAMYHFMSGYTSKVAGTERGITEPKATFSACFGEPFMLLDPIVYAKLLGERIDKYNAEVYLINTGWIGGAYGKGKRINLSYTRAMVKAIMLDKFKDVEFYEHPIFKILIPAECPEVSKDILDPKNVWVNKDAYDKKAYELAEKFEENFKRFKNISSDIINAGPHKNTI
ncbi:phosphoenolpyruvate carboxykinase (ATP) [Clostridium estertheticum]|uniref:Phosphoenolpyruvate carboxykinase (ATP) n=1 Tax=Clostridium estertheticum subsp. estertheticum TaxID=1552 RepID=A0A1J0GE79_9CLOT|nr:phosphoenolpyruvate carboxykinase (ATP) [Clostridium estertheticum]APC39214.1 phosphoenolpyruvate carboxykinase (ATP) [Clostridium estertheticum subsp. estertheticum]MBU3071861.1 phosphoenolpyruvate carboxykinase (ATP) [Clostridium estertheticum]MBU3161953.1 phosphoenolpyruvate carboxykinase (ATP) [Clostridium estertheticum]MBU3171210.1 phosphoenolpyruvate carboxykinase (ATP) [Clostridium estertheticum]MBZ9614794.1 phosphoenolpyruvate carboxykinase (ATP) [Clostridium estertheticum subsp. la